MKLFIILLCLIPHISFGLFDEYRSFGNNDDPMDKMNFEESLEHLSKSFSLLIFLAQENYAPAQENYAPAQRMLGLIHQDFSKAKDHLTEYNNEEQIPVQPPEGHSRNLLQKITDAFFNVDVSTVVNEERNAFSLSELYHVSLAYLTESFNLLDILKIRDYEPARQFQNNFEERIAGVMEKSGIPVYPLSKKLNKKCQMIFANYFASANKTTH